MSTHSTRSTGRQWSRSLRLYYPEYGLVESVLGYAVFYYVVDLVTDPLAMRLTAVLPDLTTTAVTTGLAVALWVILGLTVLGQLVEQTASNPRTFDSVEERDAFLEAHRPSSTAETLWLAGLAAGAALLALTWERFPAALERLIATIGSVEALSTISVETVLVVVAVAIGVGLFNSALDHLLIGGLRTFLADAGGPSTAPERSVGPD